MYVNFNYLIVITVKLTQLLLKYHYNLTINHKHTNKVGEELQMALDII